MSTVLSLFFPFHHSHFLCFPQKCHLFGLVLSQCDLSAIEAQWRPTVQQDFHVETTNRNNINVRKSLDITLFICLLFWGYFSGVGQMRCNFSLHSDEGFSVNFTFFIISRVCILEEHLMNKALVLHRTVSFFYPN